MNYQAQYDFYKIHDVYVTPCDVIFAIFQLYGTAAVPQRQLGQLKIVAGLINGAFHVNELMSLEIRRKDAILRRLRCP